MFYTYAHYRLDTNEIFYIGKGQDNRYLSKARSRYWHNVATKHGWRAEILAWWPTEVEAFEHERLLIDCFGRRDQGIGCLINLSDGGDGPSGAIRSDSYRANLSNYSKNRTPEHIANISKGLKGRRKTNFKKWSSQEQRQRAREQMIAMNLARRGKPLPDSAVSKLKLKRHITNGQETRFTDQQPPEGWWFGRTLSQSARQRMIAPHLKRNVNSVAPK